MVFVCAKGKTVCGTKKEAGFKVGQVIKQLIELEFH